MILKPSKGTTMYPHDHMNARGRYIGLDRQELVPYKPTRWWQFWIAKPHHIVMDAETGSYFDAGRPQGFWNWLFSRDTWFRIR